LKVTGLDSALDQRIGDRYAAVLGGEVSAVAGALTLLGDCQPAVAVAWRAVLEAAAWMLDPEHAPEPALEAIRGLVDAEPHARELAALALTHLERQALVSFDAARLDSLVALHERLLSGLSAGESAGLWLEAGRGWRALARGKVEGLEERAQTLEKHALASRIAPLVIDASVQQALAATLAGDVENATAVARRASRMARTEALPEQEFLANLTLARARRLSRHAHLAIRILTTLERVIVPHFDGWLAWELLMAGDVEVSAGLLARSPAKGPALRAARSLLAIEQAALAGERGAFEAALHALVDHTRGVTFVEREVGLLVAALDYRAPLADSSPELVRFCNGQDVLPPPELHGLCLRAERRNAAADEIAEAYVLCRPDVPPRRVLGLGAKVVDLPGTARLALTRRHQARVEIMAAVLAAAGAEGIGYVEGFEQAYEITYEQELHRGAFEVLLHRVRAHLEGVAELERNDRVLRIVPRTPLLVPDPRCTRHVHDRLLRVLARQGRATAVGAAQEVGLSLRAVQGALKALIEEGVCVSEKDGRQVVYFVEDTTFSEPTQRLAFRTRQ
jgi:hypothetical protein